MRDIRRALCVAAAVGVGVLATRSYGGEETPVSLQAVQELLRKAGEAVDRGELATARSATRQALDAMTDDPVQQLLHEAAQARDEGRMADARRSLKSAMSTSDPAFWLGLGFLAQALFTSRFLVQWIASERKGQSVIPMAFWYFSMSGSTLLLIYAIWRRDPVFIVGQAFGCIVYVRNLMLIYRRRGREESAAPARG